MKVSLISGDRVVTTHEVDMPVREITFTGVPAVQIVGFGLFDASAAASADDLSDEELEGMTDQQLAERGIFRLR